MNTAVVVGWSEGSVWLGIGNHTWPGVDVCINLRKGDNCICQTHLTAEMAVVVYLRLSLNLRVL